MTQFLQGSATYTAPSVFNDPDFHDLQPHEQAQVLGSLYPTFKALAPQDQAGIITGIQAIYNPNKSNSLTGFLNTFNAASNQTFQNSLQPNLTTQDIIPPSSNPSSALGGLQKLSPIQVPANHPLVNLLNQTSLQGGNRAPYLQKGTLLANASQKTPVSPFADFSDRQNAIQQPENTLNLKAQIQTLGQKNDQLNQVTNNSALGARTRQNAQVARLQVQNIYRGLNQQNTKPVNHLQQQQPGTMQGAQQLSPWQQLKAGKVLHDRDMRRLFQSIQPRSNSTAEQRQANLLRLYAVQKLAENILANANRAENGNVLIQGVPIRPQDALYFAKQDIQHFLDAQTHLSPNQLLVAQTVKKQFAQTVKRPIGQKHAKPSSPQLELIANKQASKTANQDHKENIGDFLNKISTIPGVLKTDTSTGKVYLEVTRPFTSTQGMGHYIKGNGIPVRVPFNWVNTSNLKPEQFPEVQRALKNPKPRTVKIVGLPGDSISIDTIGTPLGNILGRVTPRLTGTLKILPNKTWIYEGKLKIWDDHYDFLHTPGRAAIAEGLTRIGSVFPGKQYFVQIRGEKSIKSSGKL